MAINARPQIIGLTDVRHEPVGSEFIGFISDQDVDSLPGKLGPNLQLSPSIARHDVTAARPVHPVDDSHAFRIA
jgi:hypothetical protein